MNQDFNKKGEQAAAGRRLKSNQPPVREASERKRAVSVSAGTERSERAKARQRTPEGGMSLLAAVWLLICRRARGLYRRWRNLVREDRRRNFPESDHMIFQLVLLVWNMIPMLASLLRERLWNRRRHALRRSVRERRDEGVSRLRSLAMMGAGCAAAAVAVFCSMYTVGTTVIYNGQVIGAVASEAEVQAVCANLEEVTTRTLGETFTIDASLIQYSSGLLKRQDVVGQEVLEEGLSEEIGLVIPAYCLYVEGEFIGATPYEGALEELLEQLTLSATNEYTISCGFAEDVEIKQEYVSGDKIMNLGHLAEILYSTKTEEVTYEVQKGDTWTQIALNHDMTSAELEELNPGYDLDKLQIGEILLISKSVPYLTLTVVQQERYMDEVPFKIEYTNTADMYMGDYKVTAAGAYGAADVVANVTYINGEEVERTLLSSVTLREPVTEHQLRGTTPRPTWHPTGTFRWPITGRITSYFGGRKSPGGIGSTNHKGLDIGAYTGTPVYAADGGIVTYAGWMGGYGYTVVINHNYNGYETLYAHNSALTAKVGDRVYKGQQIAKVGSTGNSTGPHCHFEIRYNGVAQNPLNYLP